LTGADRDPTLADDSPNPAPAGRERRAGRRVQWTAAAVAFCASLVAL
jgi:hypothetical protein